MKKYTTYTADTCWRDCLASVLGVHPKRVPDFVKRHELSYMEKTREWLKRVYGKGLIFIPVRQFMECNDDGLNFNSPIAPLGYSMGYVTMLNFNPDKENAHHVLVCKDGKVAWDNGDDRHAEYDHLLGYFVLYDLDPSPARKVKKLNIIRKKDIENNLKKGKRKKIEDLRTKIKSLQNQLSELDKKLKS